MTPVLLDSGVVVALLDRSERYHSRCRAIIEDLDRPLITCEAVVAESCYLVRRLRGAIADVVANVRAGIFAVPFRLAPAAAEVGTILARYADLPIDLADACLVRMADEFDSGDILTLDRHFRHLRWRRSRPFRLLLDLD